MLYVKHITLSEEEIVQARSARFVPGSPAGQATPGVDACSATPPTLWFWEPIADKELPMTGGTVYVMSESGKTISRYDLGASNVPLEKSFEAV